MSLAVEQSDSAVSVLLAGELDLATIGKLMSAVERLDLGRTRRLVLDLSGLEFLDMAGLRAILRANGELAKRGIDVTVVKPRGFSSRVFTMTRDGRELNLVDRVEANGAQRFSGENVSQSSGLPLS